MSIANNKNIRYSIRQANPTRLSNLKLLHRKVTYNNHKVVNKVIAEYTRPDEFIATKFWPDCIGKNNDLINQGTPRQIKISNVFDPIELQIPIDP